MEQTGNSQAQQESSVSRGIAARFHEVLGANLKRLMGRRYDVTPFRLDLGTIAIMVLLQERESEIEASPGHPGDRFTVDTLAEELQALLPDDTCDLRESLRSLIASGYAGVAMDHGLFANNSLKNMLATLDRVFPRMSGMNFVAYLIQTMEEVLSARKELDLALEQFEHTLKNHGVELSGQGAKVEDWRPSVSAEGGGADAGARAAADKGRSEARDILASYMASRQRSEPRSAPATETAQPPPAESDAFSFQSIGPEAAEEGTAPEEEPIEGSPEQAERAAPPEEEVAGEEVGAGAESDDLSAPSAEDTDSSPEPADAAEEELEAETDEPEEAYEADLSEEEIEERISGLSDDLRMPCPLCGQGKVEENTTGKGRTYYVCSEKDCNFISWGKPYHLECPLCRNPFVVEVKGRSGKPLLKCPRAACSYRAPIRGAAGTGPGKDGTAPAMGARKVRRPRRRVRKVVVRKKK